MYLCIPHPSLSGILTKDSRWLLMDTTVGSAQNEKETCKDVTKKKKKILLVHSEVFVS